MSMGNSVTPEQMNNDDDDDYEITADKMLPERVARFLGRQQIYPDEALELSAFLFTDDDKAPIPENIPQEGETVSFHEGTWGHNNICSRKRAGGTNAPASVLIPNEFPLTVSLFRLFEAFFFKSFISEVLLPNINIKLQEDEDRDKKPVTLGEFWRWIGLWLLMATTHNQSRQDYWSKEPISPFYGVPFRLGDLMSQQRFERILKYLQFTNVDPPTTYHDPFHPVLQMIQAWNTNMASVFAPSWISCIHQSMSCWGSRSTSTIDSNETSNTSNHASCPGFMFVPRKQWALGNEWHTLCCATSGIMYAVELEEGRDRPTTAPPPELDDLGGKTVGRTLRLTRPLWHTGKVVLLDSGSCVDHGFMELAKKGVFAVAPIKKRKYWPKHIDGDMVLAHFEDSPVGHWDCYRMTVPGYDSHQPLEVYGFQEPERVSMFLSTFGTMERMGPIQTWKWTSLDGEEHQARVQYPELVHQYRQYSIAGEKHDFYRQHCWESPFPVEKALSLDSWPLQIFAFLLAITEINVKNAWTNIYGKPSINTTEFRKHLAKELIHNPYLSSSDQHPHASRLKKEVPAKRGRPPVTGKKVPPLMAAAVAKRGRPLKVGVVAPRLRVVGTTVEEGPTVVANGQPPPNDEAPTTTQTKTTMAVNNGRAAARTVVHNLMSLPASYKFQGTEMVWTELKYPQKPCSLCKRKCRDYCSCSPGTMICNRCFASHVQGK